MALSVSATVTLAIGIFVLFVILMVINLYVVVYFQKGGDKSDNWWNKILIISGLQLTSFTVMMVAVDAANNGGNPMCDEGYIIADKSLYCGGMHFYLAWQILFSAVCVYLIIFIPYATFYFEANGEENSVTAFREAVCYEIALVLCVIAIVVPLYRFSKENMTNIPVKDYAVDVSDMAYNSYILGPGSSVLAYIGNSSSVQEEPNIVKAVANTYSYPVSFDLYLISLVSWAGWFTFAIFTGTGFAAVPFDLINSFRHRPTKLDPVEHNARTLDLQVRTSEILELSMTLKRNRSSGGTSRNVASSVGDRMEVNKLTNMMHELEKDVAALAACKTSQDSYNPLIPYFHLFCGIFTLGLSIIWVLQIVLYNFTHESPLLNDYLLSFDSWFPMFGVLTYAIFALYALLCTIKGCFKIGMRCFCLCSIHTMAVGKTEVNSFLFNLGIVMLCTSPLVHFCAQSFSGYAAGSDAYLMFDVQIRNMAFFAPMFQKNIFTYMILFMFAITIPYLMCRPRDRDALTPWVPSKSIVGSRAGADDRGRKNDEESIELVSR